MTTPERAWPFAGREHHLDAIVHQWHSGGRGVIIEGSPGMGKTRLADAGAQALGAEGLRIVGNPASRTRPYAAIAHLLSGEVDGDVTRRFGELLHLARTPVVVDEAGWLDDGSLLVLNHLLSDDRVMLIATHRAGDPVPAALASIVRGHQLRTVEVGPLGRAEVEATVASALGTPLDPATLERLMNLSGGNPLFVHELVTAAMSRNGVRRLPSGVLLDFDVRSNLRLREVVGERISGLEPTAMSLVRLVAVAETLGVDDIDALGQLDVAAELERQGLLRVDANDRAEPGGAVRLAHPLHAEVLRSTMGLLEVRRQTRRAVEVVSARRRRTPDDDLRLAVWQVEIGDEPDIDVIVRGARRARAAMDLTSTLRLAQAAEQVHPGIHTQTLIMEVYFLQGRFAEAEDVARRPLPEQISPTALFTHTAIRMDNLVWGFGDHHRALQVADERRGLFREFHTEVLLDGLCAYVSAVGGHISEALALLHTEPGDAMTSLLTAPARATTLDRAGRLVESVQAADDALAILHSFPEPKALMDPAFFQVGRCLSLLALGRFEDARVDAERAHRSAVIDGVPFLRAFLPMVLGRIALAQGCTDDARAWFLESRAVADGTGMRTAERVAIGGLACVAGQRDERLHAAHLLDDFDAIDDPLDLMRVETAVGRAWAMLCVGRRTEAKQMLRGVVLERVAEEPSPCLWALTELARMDDASWAAEHLDLVAVVDGPYATTQRAFVRAIATGNVHRLDEVSAELLAIGSYPLAAEAASVLASRLAAQHDLRAAGAAQTRVNAALSQCQELATPLLALGGGAPLSNREREIALLAASGRTSREIATELHLSVRTVDNHLSRTYMKLGVSGRQELSHALARHPDGA
jgi:DNA-binding CsgD family transcriptional regulator